MYCPRYYDLYRTGKTGMEIHRAELVRYALAHGLKPAAREFQTTVKTVRKWVVRFKSLKRPGLRNQSNRPHRSPAAMDQVCLEKLERIYCERRDRNYRINAALIRREAGIPYSLPTVLKAFRSFGMKRRPTKHDTKRDLREIKAKYRAMEKIQIDVKYLDDIPELHVAYERYLLPRFQYTARCVRTGTLFIAYARELSALNSAIFLALLAKHLRRHGFDLSQTIIQTDNGSEFAEIWNSLKESLFTEEVRNRGFREHKRIPPGAKTWQSDVEASHRLIEEEFYAFTHVASCNDFLAKAQTYVEYFNLVRHNGYKGGTPRAICGQLGLALKVSLFKFPVRILDDDPQLVKDILRLPA